MAIRNKKRYRNRLSDFCAAAWLEIHATKEQGRALQRGMMDAVMNPLQDEKKSKNSEASEELDNQIQTAKQVERIKRQKPLKSQA